MQIIFLEKKYITKNKYYFWSTNNTQKIKIIIFKPKIQ